MAKDKVAKEEGDEEYTFNAVCDTIPIWLVGSDKKKRKYILQELTGEERDNYVDTKWSKQVQQKDGQTVVTNMKGMAAELIHAHLWDCDSQKKVPVGEIQGWPSKLQTKLVDLCRKISGLDAAAKKEAKND